MSLIQVQDGAGESIDLVDLDGTYRYGNFCQPAAVIADRFKSIPTFTCRDDDVFVISPLKSGTHWTCEIVSMLMNNSAETVQKYKVELMLEAIPHAELHTIDSPRVLNTHVNYRYLPQDAVEKGCKLVYVLRNPKDLAVSYYHHMKGLQAYNYDGKWENFLPLFIDGKLDYGSWFNYVTELEEAMVDNPDLPIHRMYYEHMTEDILMEITRLGKFLGVENEAGLYEKIAEKCQFQNMRKDKEETQEMKKMLFKGDFSMYRKGIIGDWKNWFTVAQNENFNKVYAEKTKGSKLNFQYEYSKTVAISPLP